MQVAIAGGWQEFAGTPYPYKPQVSKQPAGDLFQLAGGLEFAWLSHTKVSHMRVVISYNNLIVDPRRPGAYNNMSLQGSIQAAEAEAPSTVHSPTSVRVAASPSRRRRERRASLGTISTSLPLQAAVTHALGEVPAHDTGSTVAVGPPGTLMDVDGNPYEGNVFLDAK